MKKIYIKIVLLTGLLVGSQVFANNSITTSIDTQGVSKIDEIKAFYIVTDIAHGRSWNYITITSTKSGASGNGDVLKYVQTDTESCGRVSGTSEAIITCGPNSLTPDFLRNINNEFKTEGFTANRFPSVPKYTNVRSWLGDSKTWTLAGGVDNRDEVAKVVSFTPTLATSRKEYTISINGDDYSTTVTGNTTIKGIVEALQMKVISNSMVTCTEDDTKLTCTSNAGNPAFTYSSSVIDLANETDAERAARLANEAWQNQLGVVSTFLTTANTARENATTAISSNDSLPSKFASINQSTQANVALLAEIQKLSGLKRTDADNATVESFEQQYQTLNTATNALMANYTEQKRVADLEIAWQNQLTVVTSSLATANTARENATATMNNNYNNLPSKFASIEASKQANVALLAEIQKLSGFKRTDADNATVENFEQQYQTLNTATNALMANYEEQKRVADLEIAWQNQLTVVTSSLTTANNARANAITVINGNDSLPSKLASIEASKQANASLLSEIRKLNGLKRTNADSATVESFEQQYQTLNTATNTLRASYEEQVRILEVAWQNQLTVVTNSVTAANTAQANATTTMGNNYNSLPSKLASIEASKQANAALLLEIQKLDGLKITDANSATVDDFNQQYQTLNTATNTLMTNYEGQRDAVNKATILTGYWKTPVIKGLDYTTATHSSVTDENGAFKCQSGENVTFSIASLVLTSIPCTEILNTKTTNNISLNATSSDGFKDWKDETNKQMLITKVLFGLFGKNIKTAFAQEDEALKFITVELTEAQKSNTMNRSLDANDLNLLVQNILGITEPVVLPTTEQAENMVTSGWQASKVFDGAISNDDSTDTGASTKSSSGGGCVYNPNAPARFDMGFILLMVLSAYYLIRRKRRFV